ncbi:glycosyltransferase [Aeromonas veronii]
MNKLNNMAPINLLIVIVLYEKKISEISFLNKIKNSNTNIDILIYDNSFDPQVCKGLNLTYYHDPSNPGVSTAYNYAFSYANENNKSAVLLLDQDTSFEPDSIYNYLSMYNKYGDLYIYAPIITDAFKNKVYSPSYMKNFVGKVSSFSEVKYKEVYEISNKSIINSGLLIPIKIFNKIGGYNDKIKLDFSDVFFIEKYRSINDTVILINCYIRHNLSGDEGLNFNAEMKRFPYYCNGAIELSKSLKVKTTWTVVRRTISLVSKYRSIIPVLIFLRFYVARERV